MPAHVDTVNRGLIIQGPGEVSLESLPMPVPGSGEVRVRMRYVALCGSDRKLFEGSYKAPHKYPILIGHEWVGVVDALGADCAPGLSVGDLVTGDCSLYCGECFYCTTEGNRNHCLSIQKRGITVDGACADYMVINRRHLYRCEGGGELLSYVLTEPMSVSATALGLRFTREQLKKVRKALIIGAGGIGALALFTLRDYGIQDITIVDIVKEKLAVSESMGLPGVKVLASDLSDLPENSFDLILEASGSGAGLKRTVVLAAPDGKIVLIGHQGSLELDFGLVMKKSLTLAASMGSTGGFEEAARIIAANREAVSKVVTRIVPMGEAVSYLKEGRPCPADLKVVIDLG
nr:alcohol dehydrogenase catalytic domain-containing protein [uncultured Holophaga sp.]